MCGRFTLTQTGKAVAEAFQLATVPSIEPRYNISPTQPAPVVFLTENSRDRQFTYMYWGLIPSWADDPKIGSRLINARSETVTEKPSFRNAFKRRRCLIVADGFYEWKTMKGRKQPFYIQVNGANDQSSSEQDSGQMERSPFAFAGLWEHWQSKDGSEIESCTILTTEPNDLLRTIHNRMPVILRPKDYDRWLDPKMQNSSELQSLLQPFDADRMAMYPVSTDVNSPKHEGQDCIQPVEMS